MVTTQARSAERFAAEESQHKREVLSWADVVADKVIKAALEDAALRFLDRDLDADERSVDLGAEFDPVVAERTGQRLSEAIEEAADRFHRKPEAMRRLYLRALKKEWKRERRRITHPEGRRYGVYMVSRHGVWSKQYASGGESHSGPYVWRRIAKTRVDPVALSRDTSSQRNWRTRFLVTDETGEFPVDIGHEHLTKKAERAINILIKHGVRVVESDDARRHLAVFLRFRPKVRIIRAPTTGWFAPRKNKPVFVLPTETLGDDGSVAITVDATDGHGLHRSGTSEQWRRYVAAPLAGNSNVILSTGTFLANPVLPWGDEPSGLFHLYGQSKIGKTLAGAAGQSVWGKPYAPGAGANAFGYTWETTANRLGQRATLRNHIGLYLDEIGVGNPHAIAPSIYKLAGGLDKGRYGQAERDFNLLGFSTGELSLAEFLPNVRAGQLVRMVDIPALVQPASALETVPQSEIDAAGQRFYAATAEYPGSVGYDWLKHLVAIGPPAIKAKLKDHRGAWLALTQVAEIKSRAHPQVVSVVNRFAFVAAALRMAIDAGIVPWASADTDAGIIACMDRWVRQRGNTDAAGELLQEIHRRRQTFAATSDDRLIRLGRNGSRLVPASAADRNKIDAATRGDAVFDGYVKDQRILLTPDAWQRLWVGLDADAVKDHLLRMQLLMPGEGAGRATFVEKVGRGAPSRFYVLAEAFVSVLS
jgi:hypothetical protein